MRLAVVIPTIAGREEMLDRTLAAYRLTAPAETIYLVVRNRPTIGEAWRDGSREAVGLDRVTHVHLAADDIKPAEGALRAGMDHASESILASPRITNPDGSLLQAGSMGAGMLLPETDLHVTAGTSQFPMLTRDVAEQVLPYMPDIHYYADDWLAWAVRSDEWGWSVVACPDYAFQHMEGSVGRPAVALRAREDRASFLSAVASGVHGLRGLAEVEA